MDCITKGRRQKNTKKGTKKTLRLTARVCSERLSRWKRERERRREKEKEEEHEDLQDMIMVTLSIIVQRRSVKKRNEERVYFVFLCVWCCGDWGFYTQ